MEPSIFTRIIQGEIPCHKVYEDEKIFAFMDIHPIQPGMVLVVPKAQVPNFYELNDADYQAVWAAVKKIAQKQKQIFPDKNKIAVQVEGLEVEHAHVKVFPFDTPAEFHASPVAEESDHQALASLAEKLSLSDN